MSVVLDPTALANLAAMSRPGRPSVLVRVVELFLEDAPGLVATLSEASQTGDLEAVRMAAHSLKSSAAYVGATELSFSAAEIERAAREGDIAPVVPAIHELGSSLDSVAEALAGEVSKAA